MNVSGQWLSHNVAATPFPPQPNDQKKTKSICFDGEMHVSYLIPVHEADLHEREREREDHVIDMFVNHLS